MSVLDDKTNTVTPTIPVGKTVAGIALNPSTDIAYVTNYNEKTVSVIYGKTNGTSLSATVKSLVYYTIR